MFRLTRLALVVVPVIVAAACGGGETAPPASDTAAAPPVAAAPAAAPAAEPQTVADIFPPGAARDQVLNSCSSCHSVACAAIGQRSAERWNALKESHRENVSGADLDAIFTYLNEHFGADKPEPRVPPAFLEGGCTPF
ncbi:MAG: hypothetical protein AB7P22_06485 [Vicinamibacterales bacterium]